MRYKFKYRPKWWPLWRTIKASGHQYDKESDRMSVFLESGGLVVIPNFSKCYQKLGKDWAIATQKQMEKEANQPVVTHSS